MSIVFYGLGVNVFIPRYAQSPLSYALNTYMTEK